MRVLIIGSGGREHALGWRIAQDSSGPHDLFFISGNPGTGLVGENLSIAEDAMADICSFVQNHNIECVVVGPEVPLRDGIVDEVQKFGCPVFGPTRAAAEIETSKRFAKEIMTAAGVPTARYHFCESEQEALAVLPKFGPVYVLKADGLAAGKGVVVTESQVEAEDAIREHFTRSHSGEGVLLEQFLEGREVSFIVMTDGERIVPFPTASDYKRIYDGDRGPNTGGMGTVSPSPNIAKGRESEIVARVIRPVLVELAERGRPFTGFLYAGLMIAPSGEINVVEFNARMGDPEAQVLVRRFSGDLMKTIYALATSSDVPPVAPESDDVAVCVVMASEGYPLSARKGVVIEGIAEAEGLGNVVVFQAGTAMEDESLITNGGRVLGVTALGDSINEARLKAYHAVERISFAGQQFRTDIGMPNQ